MKCYRYQLAPPPGRPVTSKVTSKTFRRLGIAKWNDLRGGKETQSQGDMIYSLGQDYSTVSWRLTEPGTETDFGLPKSGESTPCYGWNWRQNHQKTLDIDNAPFFSNPSLELWHFAQTGAKKIDLWFLEPSRLSKYKMQSVNRGVETIIVNGQPIEAVRTGWGLPGWKSILYQQTYRHRKSDGVYLKTDVSEGQYSELVKGITTLAHFENLDHCLIVIVEKRSAI